jgi:RNA polymerase-binding transcription factor DksA
LTHDQPVEIHTRRIDNQKFRQIEAALDRINHREFGTCQECGEAIARRRLDAVPWAAYSVPCQEQLVEATDADSKKVAY